MSKSFKRNNKYISDDSYSDHEEYDHRQHLKEKRLRAALKSKNKDVLFDLTEED